MPKSLDGIKKLNPDEIKKSREIVLNYIGENDRGKKIEVDKEKVKKSILKKVDGLWTRKEKISTMEATVATPVAEVKIKADEEDEIHKKLKVEEEKRRLKEAIKRQEEARARLIEEDKQIKLTKEREIEETKNRERELERLKEENKKEEQRKKREDEERRKREEIERIEEEKRKRKEALKLEEEKRKRLEKEKKEEKERKIKEEKERAEEEERLRKEAEKLGKDKERRALIEERKRIKDEAKRLMAERREKLKLARAKRYKRMRKNIKIQVKAAGELLRNYYRPVGLVILLIIAGAIFFYGIFIVIVLNFRIDNNISRKISEYLPVPALVTKLGVVSYYDYLGARKKFSLSDNEALKADNLNNELIKDLIYKKLLKKYGIIINSYNLDTKNKILAENFARDKEINKIGRARIEKIYNLLSQGKTMEEINNYSDGYSAGEYLSPDAITTKFGVNANNLKVDELSNIITTENGYYILEKIGERGSNIGLKYVFIKALTLDEYVNKQLENLKIYSFVN